MADKEIKEGDTVSWKLGSDNPSGEVKTSAQLEIETAGKKVRTNADEDNPAVHVAREGNDVKEASELAKESREDVEMKDEAKEEKEVGGKFAGEKRDRDDVVEEDADAKGDGGEKAAVIEEQADADKETEKQPKKPKLDSDEEKKEEGSSRPKKKAAKSSAKAKKSDDSKPAIFHDTPAARTRSKATA